MRIEIIAPTGSSEHRAFAEQEIIRIGRDPESDVVLEDIDVSRHHATLQRLKSGWLLVDRSSNGTYLEDEFLCQAARPLAAPALLKMGGFSLRLSAASAPPASAGERGDVLPKAAAAAAALPIAAALPDAAEPSGRVGIGLRKQIHRELLENLDLCALDRSPKGLSAMRPEVIEALSQILERLAGETLSAGEKATLVAELADETLGLGPLESLLCDDDVSEIMVVDPQTIYCERRGVIEKTALRFTDDESARAIIERIVTPLGRRIDESSPCVDARLHDGSRVHAAISPVALRGTCITIRKFRKETLKIDDLIAFGSMTDQMARFLSRSVQARKNIIISGGTGSGKTTLLNVLAGAIPETERIVTIEDAAELKLQQDHVVSLETRPPNMEGEGEIPIRELVRNALRMRPDRIIVGECRGGEALDMMQAMNTGHDGSMTTTHANTPSEAVARIETLVLMAGIDLPMRAIREQLVASIDLVVQQTRLADGSRRITSISEVVGMADERVELCEIFSYDRLGTGAGGEIIGEFRASGYLPTYLGELIRHGLVEEGQYL